MTNSTLNPTKVNSVPNGTKAAIVYFDGVCGFCNEGVNFLMNRDPDGKFVYAPLQGETAQKNLSPKEISQLETLVVTIDGKNSRKSAAIVRILWKLGTGWGILGTALWLVPRPLRDIGYTLVARNRYRLFGKHDACRMPTPEERNRFLP